MTQVRVDDADDLGVGRGEAFDDGGAEPELAGAMQDA